MHTNDFINAFKRAEELNRLSKQEEENNKQILENTSLKIEIIELKEQLQYWKKRTELAERLVKTHYLDTQASQQYKDFLEWSETAKKEY